METTKEETKPEPVELGPPKVEAKKPHKKRLKPRLEAIEPSHIVEVIKLHESSLKHFPMLYPSMEEEAPANVRAQLFNMIAQPGYVGYMAFIGRKPVGQFSGFIQTRPFGAPRVFFAAWLFWVEPEARGSGIAEELMKSVFKSLKAKGVFNFEWHATPELVSIYEKVYGGPLKVVSHRIIGKVTSE